MRKNERNKSNSDLLIEDLKHFLARAAFQQLAMHFQALDCLGATFGWPEFQRLVLRWVVLSWLRQLHDDVLDLHYRNQGGSIHCGIETNILDS